MRRWVRQISNGIQGLTQRLKEKIHKILIPLKNSKSFLLTTNLILKKKIINLREVKRSRKNLT